MPKKQISLFDLFGTFDIPTDDASLEKAFKAMDVNGDGNIDYREFVNVYKQYEADLGVNLTTGDIGKLFRRTSGGDLGIQLPEFKRMMRERANKI